MHPFPVRKYFLKKSSAIISIFLSKKIFMICQTEIFQNNYEKYESF